MHPKARKPKSANTQKRLYPKAPIPKSAYTQKRHTTLHYGSNHVDVSAVSKLE
jgi:hypothetical protein